MHVGSARFLPLSPRKKSRPSRGRISFHAIGIRLYRRPDGRVTRQTVYPSKYTPTGSGFRPVFSEPEVIGMISLRGPEPESDTDIDTQRGPVPPRSRGCRQKCQISPTVVTSHDYVTVCHVTDDVTVCLCVSGFGQDSAQSDGHQLKGSQRELQEPGGDLACHVRKGRRRDHPPAGGLRRPPSGDIGNYSC